MGAIGQPETRRGRRDCAAQGHGCGIEGNGGLLLASNSAAGDCAGLTGEEEFVYHRHRVGTVLDVVKHPGHVVLPVEVVPNETLSARMAEIYASIEITRTRGWIEHRGAQLEVAGKNALAIVHFGQRVVVACITVQTTGKRTQT